MSDMDRFTVSGLSSLTAEERIDYVESNCVSDPIKMCDFTEQPGRILKTVDSVHQDIATLADCRKLCLQSTEFRCHSFDFEDTGPKVRGGVGGVGEAPPDSSYYRPAFIT